MDFDCNGLRVGSAMLLVLLLMSSAAAKKDTDPANYPLVAHIVSVSINRVHLISRESGSVEDNSSGHEYQTSGRTNGVAEQRSTELRIGKIIYTSEDICNPLRAGMDVPAGLNEKKVRRGLLFGGIPGAIAAAAAPKVQVVELLVGTKVCTLRVTGTKEAQAAVAQSEPDCGETTEEDARREAIAWANKHPEYHPTAENAQNVIGYMENHRLCPTQQNFDTAYNAVHAQNVQSATDATKTEPQQTLLMLDGRGGAFNHRFAADCPELGMAFPFERGQPDSQWAVALVNEPSPAWILFRTPSNDMHVVLAPESDVDSAARRACDIVKKPETATWVPN